MKINYEKAKSGEFAAWVTTHNILIVSQGKTKMEALQNLKKDIETVNKFLNK
jgi:predicted RNase H-like HicB family nuclease